MSWGFKIAAKSKTGALNKLSEKVVQSQGSIPQTIAAAISSAIEALPEGSTVYVESNGHIDSSSGGNATFIVNKYLDVVD